MENKTNKKISIAIFSVIIILMAVWFRPAFVFALDCSSDNLTPEEKEECDDKEDEYKDKKHKIKKKVEKELEKKNNLQSQLGAVKQSLGKTKRTINDVILDIEKKEDEIARHDAQIKALDNQVVLYKSALSDMMRSFYYSQNNRALNAVVKNGDGSGRFLDSTDSLHKMRTRIVDTVNQIKKSKQQQQKKKEELASLKEEKEKLLAEHKKKEAQLLSQAGAVQTELIKVDTTIAQLNSKLADVESKLSSLLGESFSTDDIVKAAKFASKKTGVRKSFILGMLVVETDLGRFTGGCTYKKSKMGDKNAKIFKRITKDLGYNYKKVKVSCPLSYGIGGAMGVAQFMPTTWVGYESKIEKYTGHHPADPWSLTDGVMAMAIKLANDGATHERGEFDAARRYYCGSRLDRSACINYGNKVLYWAKNYKDRL